MTNWYHSRNWMRQISSINTTPISIQKVAKVCTQALEISQIFISAIFWSDNMERMKWFRIFENYWNHQICFCSFEGRYLDSLFKYLFLGSLVLFSMRLIHAEALRFTSNPWATLERIDRLEKNVNKVTYKFFFFSNFYVFTTRLFILKSLNQPSLSYRFWIIQWTKANISLKYGKIVC